MQRLSPACLPVQTGIRLVASRVYGRQGLQGRNLVSMPRTRRVLHHPGAIFELSLVELLGGKAGNGRVHAILDVQHVHRVAGCLQAFEEGHIVLECHSSLADDRCGQLDWVADQVHLHGRSSHAHAQTAETETDKGQ